ncbi:MAG: rod shape-determining protein RodA [Bacteroidales bacterium]|nr:rod shape-determining protein RodA [Bacteroidales bacterium]
MRDGKSILNNIDWVIVLLYLLLVFAGWINIYAAVYNDEHKSIVDISQSYGKQLIWIASSIIIALIILMIDAKFISAFSYVIYIFHILLLIAVLVVGKEIAGSKSWFQIGSFALQPAEFAKYATNLAVAKYLSTLNINIKSPKSLIRVIFILGIPTVLILLQNDTGSALVYVAFIFVLFRQGMSGNILFIGLIAVILFILTLLVNKFIVLGIIAAITLISVFLMRKNRRDILTMIGLFVLISAYVYSVDYAFDNFLEPHHQKRINVLIGKETDLRGAGYNVNQSKIAIGSGGLTGKGFLQGTQTKFNFVPEQSTDFIFCTVGEEWGFLGSFVVIGLFMTLFIRIIIIAERQRSVFSRIYGYGLASILFFHFLINIGMTIGLSPVIGIPLPFFSYGGSSLWAFTILLFIFVKQDASRLESL